MAITYSTIATTTLSSAASSITFSSIPNTYTDLVLIISTLGATGDYVSIRFNGDTSTNYSWNFIGSDGGVAYATRGLSQTQGRVGNSMNSASSPNTTIVDIFNYASSSWKGILSKGNSDISGSGELRRYVNTWRSTNAINTILLRGDAGANFAIGTTATLYGILKA